MWIDVNVLWFYLISLIYIIADYAEMVLLAVNYNTWYRWHVFPADCERESYLEAN